MKDFYLVLILFISSIHAQIYNVKDFNATGDGKTDDTKAVRDTLAAAANSNGGRVIFDSGYTFLTGCFNVTSNIILDVRGTILASVDPATFVVVKEIPWHGNGHVKQPIVYSYNATNITITGGGIIDGQGTYWYPCRDSKTEPPCGIYPAGRPRLIQLTYTSNIIVENILLKDSPYWTLHLAYTSNVYINNITVVSPIAVIIINGSGLMTDGIDVDCSKDVLIENCRINTADDAVSVKAGNDEYGRKYGRTTENVMVRNLTVGYSNGFAVGAEMAAGVRNVTFQDSIINGSLHAILLKCMLGMGGYIQDITYSNLQIYNTNYTIELNMYYTLPGNDTSIPVIKNIIVSNISGDNANSVYNINGLPQSPIQNVYLENIKITHITRSIVHRCQNINGICSNSTVIPYCPPCMKTESCFDASDSCLQYVNLCNSQAYRTMLCDQCRKTCNLCQSC